MNIAIIAHDNKKADMVAFIMKRLDYFKSKDVKLYATGTNWHTHQTCRQS
jgi:methylglyoxal synthase